MSRLCDWKAVLLPAALAFSFTAFAADAGFAQITAGTITGLNGISTITRAGRKFRASYSAPVDVGDQIDTTSTGRVTVRLSDGSELELSESSSLRVSEDLINPNGSRDRTIVNLFSGLVRSWVKTVSGTPLNYEVHTPNAVASARGTTYDTYYTNHETRPGFKDCKEFTDVFNYDGIVLVTSLANPTSPPVELHSGQKTTIPCGLGISPPAAIAASTSATGGANRGAGTLGGGTGTVGIIAGGLVAVLGGGVAGGYAAAGGFDPASPSAAAAINATAAPEISLGGRRSAFYFLGFLLLLLIERLRRR